MGAGTCYSADGGLVVVESCATPGSRSRSSAPRGALSYPRHSREELGGRFLGLMAYPAPKGEGDQSMPANQRPGPGVRDGALGDPRDMAKAGLPESQSPEGEIWRLPERRLKPVPAPAAGLPDTCRNPPGCRSDAPSGHSRRRTGRLSRARTYGSVNVRSPKGRES